MAVKRKTQDNANPPHTLDDHIFFGLKLDQDQKKFRDAIWNPDIDIVFCEARSGCGKSLISVATGTLMYQYGLVSGIQYVIMATGQDKIGFLPGDSLTKVMPLMSGLWSAIQAINLYPEKVIKGLNVDTQKFGDAFISAQSSTFLRGSNFNNKVVIIDEAQNMTVPQLRKTLTRVCNGCKTIVIGHTLQTDIPQHLSGFVPCMEHFKSKNNPRFAFCQLNTCHRGLVAKTADEEW